MQAHSTMFVADVLRSARHHGGVLDSKGLVAELERLKSVGLTTNADLARLLKLPTARIAEMFAGKRRITIDEMKVLVEHFGLEAVTPVPSAETLEPILDALLPLTPPGRLSEQSRRALAEALSYGLELLGTTRATPANDDALRVAARAAASRFREQVLA